MKWAARAILALAVLAGIVAMHALDLSLDSTAAMSPHASMATSMTTTPLAGDADVLAHAVTATQRWHSACTHEHCLATLRPVVALPAPGQVVATGKSLSLPVSVAVQQGGAARRAPPPGACLNLLCVSRT